jgi:tetratricopeptide (TPR) repeat protein
MGLAGVCACAAPIPAKPAAPSQPLDIQLPGQAPEPQGMSQLPALWEHEQLGSAYRIETGPLSGPANFDDLDGPFSSQYARNPYVISEGSDDGRKLVIRLPSAAARPLMEQANRDFGAGLLDQALSSYQQAIERDPQFAKPYFYVAEILSRRRDLEAATIWNERGLRLSPRDPYGYALRSEIAMALGKPDVARTALAYALALDPFSPQALKLLEKFGARLPGIQPPVFVQRHGRVLVARGGGHPAWQRYAICRALLEHDTKIRGQFVQSAAQSMRPGTRSLEEETVCGYLATAVYRLSRVPGGPAPDRDLERWSKAYDLSLLREAIIYETVGCRRPDVLPLLTDEAVRRIVEYVRLFVIPQTPRQNSG